MKTYNEAELNKKITSFLDRKMEKFPELQRTKAHDSVSRKDFLNFFSHGLKTTFSHRVHA